MQSRQADAYSAREVAGDMTKKVFVVEDEAAFITLYREIFPKYGLEMIGHAADGEEALRKLEEGLEPDIVVVDHRLPRKDGLNTMKEMLRKDPSLPIVFTSADIDVREEVLESGALDFLVKPFTKDQLVAMIEKHSRKH